MLPIHPLFLAGKWQERPNPVEIINPATQEVTALLCLADQADLEDLCHALPAAQMDLSKLLAAERAQILRKAASLLRERVEPIAARITAEQGKPLSEARLEVLASATAIDWLAEEARRIDGKILQAGPLGQQNLVLRQPLGPVAAFTPWNFPIHQAARKLASAFAAGCVVVLKAAEETPGPAVELIRAFDDAGAPKGSVSLIFGDPAQISTFLIRHPAIRKITFTGSTSVGRVIGGLAGQALKPATLELGGHAPVILDEDADIETALDLLVGAKLRNAGQICISPTRFLVHDRLYDAFVKGFRERASHVVIGAGDDPSTTMGPLANERRLRALQAMLDDAAQKGARISELCQIPRHSKGWFFTPRLLEDIRSDMAIMNEEPFGPLVPVWRFDRLDDALSEANRLDFGLAAYGFARAAKSVYRLGHEMNAGMVAVNHLNVASPELPFGGIGASGHGSECGPDALAPFLGVKSFTANLA